MQCPLCINEAEFETIFSHKCSFVSCSTLDTNPTPINDDSYGKGGAEILLMQCKMCGFIFNEKFNQNLIAEEYKAKNYLSRKIVSKAMNSSINTIKSAIIKHYAAMSQTMGGGGGYH